jgi:hypothetical protein
MLDKRSNNLVAKVLLSTKKPKSLIKINRMGGNAKLAKNAVAPAKRKGSFFLKSLNATFKCLKNNLDLLSDIAYMLAF